jgi:hypothetical protein
MNIFAKTHFFFSFLLGVEWKLSNFARATITAVVFIGELAGGMFWGPFAGKIAGRYELTRKVSVLFQSGNNLN